VLRKSVLFTGSQVTLNSLTTVFNTDVCVCTFSGWLKDRVWCLMEHLASPAKGNRCYTSWGAAHSVNTQLRLLYQFAR